MTDFMLIAGIVAIGFAGAWSIEKIVQRFFHRDRW